MTNDELEAVRARAENDDGWHDVADDAFVLLDEVERLHRLVDMLERLNVIDRTDDGHVVAGWIGEGERRRKEMAVEIAGLRRSYTDEKVKAASAEAHAERLAGALEETLAAVESHRRNVLGATQSEYAASDDRLLVARSEARSALSAYRGEKDEACSRPSDALDAPVQPTSSHLGNGADQ